jgi:mono/diheme cytochrome c family protein
VKNLKNYLVAALFFSWLLLAVRGSAGPPSQQQQKANNKPAEEMSTDKTDESAEGQKRFEANCGRCHQPPEDISPREVKAVLRHMRVRANLSAEDERLILKFLAP